MTHYSEVLKVSIRQSAIFIPEKALVLPASELSDATLLFVTNLQSLGFGLDEKLLHQLNRCEEAFQKEVLSVFSKILGVENNWTPLVKQWDTPTGESAIDHWVTYFTNIFQLSGTKLACGHVIPENTFPLERYNGCPYCGKPFEFDKLTLKNQASTIKLLKLWTEDDVSAFFKDLLESKTALDATQMDSLYILLYDWQLPEAEVGMKETLMAVIDYLFDINRDDKASILLRTPVDIMRYLWYKHTGNLQIVQPQVVVRRTAKNFRSADGFQKDKSAEAHEKAKEALKLKYDRKTCKTVAIWLNNLPMTAEKSYEMMHPKRSMWVRFIRALRLAEYAKKTGFDNLKKLLDVFYNQKYKVWAGELQQNFVAKDAEKTLNLLKLRPGLFARSIFAAILRLGLETTCQAFEEVIDKVPARLVFTLNMYAKTYFNPNGLRAVKPLGGVNKSIPKHPFVLQMTAEDRIKTIKRIENLCVTAIKKRFAGIKNENKTLYIEPVLFNLPVSIGDRSGQIQELPVALMGTRFPIEGNNIRLFMQWGTGLSAQHLDMDLSILVANFDGGMQRCSYSNLVIDGALHSGDIRQIPEQVGTAEYIELYIDDLEKSGAKYVCFACNAYTSGALSPNMVVGWMDSKHKMTISESGVAYDPSCVQFQIKITQNLAKGLVFGVLDVKKREITWLEMVFDGSTVHTLDIEYVESLLEKLQSKLNIGNLLMIKAEAQNLTLVDTPEQADEVYLFDWAKNTAAVTRLLVD